MSSRRLVRPGACVALTLSALAAAALVPAAAAATTVATGGFQGELQVTAGPGEANDLAVEVAPAAGKDVQVTVDDTGAGVQPGQGCDANTPGGPVSCTVSGLYIVFVDMGDLDDSLSVDNGDAGVQFTVTAGTGADTAAVGPEGEICLDGGSGADRIDLSTPTMACTVDGGEGPDAITGSSGQDRLYGGTGRDSVDGAGGPDYVYGDDGQDQVRGGAGDDGWMEGGSGDDRLNGGPGRDGMRDAAGDDVMLGGAGDDFFSALFYASAGDDVYRGGTGIDRFRYLCPSCDVTLDGVANDGRVDRGERDNVEVEWVALISHTPRGDEVPPHDYGSGRDEVVGDGSANNLRTQRGDDTLDGRGGADRFAAGGGHDLVMALDGETDLLVDCGAGHDQAIVDPEDPLRDCEDVSYSQPRWRK
jgi:Ca2+-binding RTX toxin-like protein